MATMDATTTVGSNNAAAVYNSALVIFAMLNLILCSIASVLSLVLIVAMTIPLLYPKMRKKYSTYNLYLAYLSIPDMVNNVFILCLTLLNTKWNPDETRYNGLWFFDLRWDNGVYPMCTTGNLYTNAFLTYEIYKLLRDSSLRKRYYPPTLWEVTKHAMISYGLGMTIFLFDCFVVADRLYDTTWASPAMLSALQFLYWAASLTICILIPLLFWMGVSGTIFWQGFIGSTRSLYEGRLRVLTLFFLRIAFIDVLIWIPCLIRYTMQWISNDERTQVITYHTALLFSGIQVIANFACVLTKPDSRMLIVDLLTLVYCRKRAPDADVLDQDREQADELGRRHDPFLRTSLAIFRPRRASESSIQGGLSMTLHSLSQSHTLSFSQRSTHPPTRMLSEAKEHDEPRQADEETNSVGASSEKSEDVCSRSYKTIDPFDIGKDPPHGSLDV